MIHSKRSQEGYLLVDHRASPGVQPEDLDNVPLPWRDQFVASVNLFEAPTMRCSHCGTFVILNPDRKRERNYCSRCDHYVCDYPGCVVECEPFNKKIDVGMEQAALLINLREV